MAQHTVTRDSQLIKDGKLLMIGAREFTVDFSTPDEAATFIADSGHRCFLRGYDSMPGHFSLVAFSSLTGEPEKAKSGHYIELFVVADTLTDMTGLKRNA